MLFIAEAGAILRIAADSVSAALDQVGRSLCPVVTSSAEEQSDQMARQIAGLSKQLRNMLFNQSPAIMMHTSEQRQRRRARCTGIPMGHLEQIHIWQLATDRVTI